MFTVHEQPRCSCPLVPYADRVPYYSVRLGMFTVHGTLCGFEMSHAMADVQVRVVATSMSMFMFKFVGFCSQFIPCSCASMSMFVHVQSRWACRPPGRPWRTAPGVFARARNAGSMLHVRPRLARAFTHRNAQAHATRRAHADSMSGTTAGPGVACPRAQSTRKKGAPRHAAGSARRRRAEFTHVDERARTRAQLLA